jgi:transposase
VDTRDERTVFTMQRRRKRLQFTHAFKADAVKLVRDAHRTVPQVAKELDLTESAFRTWVQQAEVDEGQGRAGALTSEEKTELAHLRQEVRALRMERDILKKAAAFFAKEST